MPKHVLAISGSTRADSTNARLIRAMAALAGDAWSVREYDQLDQLPHFNPDLDKGDVPGMDVPGMDVPGMNVPTLVAALRAQIAAADGVLICTPEYVFSLPGSLKNLLEWLVSTTLLTDKPAALITASAAGEKAHEALQLIVGTLQARFTPQTTLLISGIRGKVSPDGQFTNVEIQQAVTKLVAAFTTLMQDG